MLAAGGGGEELQGTVPIDQLDLSSVSAKPSSVVGSEPSSVTRRVVVFSILLTMPGNPVVCWNSYH